MEIIKPGKTPQELAKERKNLNLTFSCENCGCVFKANIDDCKDVGLTIECSVSDFSVSCVCPNCGKTVIN